MSGYTMNTQNLIIKEFKHIIVILSALICLGFGQQITINRVELMPNMPSPYEMRDWKRVALGYDSLVFNHNLMGTHLPLIFWRSNTVNYPGHPSFGLHTYVGTNAPTAGEAINVIPAVVGASLVGIDKSNQNGYNWVLMCEEYFNKISGEYVYLNHPVTHTGVDWWYETMPNLFFYQLYDMYPGTGDFAYQFHTVADRWLEAVDSMGGSTTPWQRPYMNYRAFNLLTMTPLTTGTPEPEAAGAIAWILYNAYSETGTPEYLVGAEWAMEFLSNWILNPSYELQLPYGAYTAARMNAELGTVYDIEKIINWCFEVGSLRYWGVIVGNWGGYDCYGLVGEANGPGHYAFNMNGLEQVGALLPMVRYDDRFARAIGKWVLNVANATRLMYSNYLPDTNQSNATWAHQYDPNSYIGYEAMRRVWNTISPYATGDAMAGSWAATNLALYGSSHVGILGGIIDTTNIPMILKLDALVTDYFHDPAYPTFLYFNPYDSAQIVEINAGTGLHDLYDATTNSFLATNVSGATTFTLSADAAVLLVITPAGGTVSYNLDQMLINDVVVDYSSGQMVSNYPPRIKSIAAYPDPVIIGQNTTVYCSAEDRDNDSLHYSWSSTAGTISGDSSEVTWTAPNLIGGYLVACIVSDGNGGLDTAYTDIEVVESINHDPLILNITAQPRKIDLGATSNLTCSAQDPDGDTLTYTWSALSGSIISNDSAAVWTAPMSAGNYYVTCEIDDGQGAQDIDSIAIVVRDFTNVQTGDLVAHYPFNGNANDATGNGHDGTVYGAALTQDRFGNPGQAYYFDGVDDYINIPNHDSLNFRAAISINFWMKVDEFFAREAFAISHGSWQYRWKASIIPGQLLRWTIKTDRPVNNGVIDLDTETNLDAGIWYNITLFFDGSDFEIHLDGNLDSFNSWSGMILTTIYDMTIAQMLPNNNSYNFKGVLDDIRIYNYGLSVEEIQNLAAGTSGIHDSKNLNIPRQYHLAQNFPNPFNPTTTIQFSIPENAPVKLSIFDITGRVVAILIDQKLIPGVYQFDWNATEAASGIYFYCIDAGVFSQTKKMILLK